MAWSSEGDQRSTHDHNRLGRTSPTSAIIPWTVVEFSVGVHPSSQYGNNKRTELCEINNKCAFVINHWSSHFSINRAIIPNSPPERNKTYAGAEESTQVTR